MKAGSTGNIIIIVAGVFLILNLCDYSRRCERQFRSKDEIVKVRERPEDHSVEDFRNIFIVFAQIVRQLFEHSDWLKTPYPILFVRLQNVRELGEFL